MHDAARPCLSHELVDAVFDAALEHGAALLAVQSRRHDQASRRRSSHHRHRPPRAASTSPRRPRFSAAICSSRRTPSAAASPPATSPTTASSSRRWDSRCAIVEGSALNIKITTHADLKLAAAILPLLEKPRREGSAHPYSDEQAMWGDLPKLKASDLFGS